MITVHSLKLVNRSEDLSRVRNVKGAEAEGLLGQSSGVKSGSKGYRRLGDTPKKRVLVQDPPKHW